MEYFLLASMGFFAAITPGPDIFYIVRQAMCRGFKIAIIAIFGILFGNIIYLTLVGLGLGSIGKNSYFQAVVGFLGALYLIRIAYLIYKDKPHIDKECINLNRFNLFKEALLLNLSNPKAMIFFAVVITPFLTKNVMFSLASLFVGIALAFIVSAFVASIFNIKESLLIVINKVSSFIFIFFAIILLKTAYEAIIEIIK